MKLTLLFALLLVNATVAFMAPGVTEAHTFKQQRNQRNPLQQKCRYNSCNMGKTKTKARISHVRYAADPAKNANKKGEALPVMTESQLQEHDDELDEEKFADGKLNGSYLILGILLITFASNQWSRQALYYLCDFSSNADPFKHINAAVGFDKEQYASLASFGFTIIFAVVSLFAGGVSDRYDRNVVTALSCGVWSVATAVQGLATGFNELIPLRAVIGASQAFFNPAAYTLLSEIFPKKIIGSINGIFSSGVYLGGGLASLSIILDSSIGWRNTLFVIGGLGVLISGMCYFLVSEPRAVIRKMKEDERKENSNILSSSLTTTAPATVDVQSVTDIVSSAITSLKEVLESNEARLLFFASVLRFCAGFSIAIWKAPFVFAKFPENASSFAGSNAVIVALGGLVSSLIGGVISDRLANPPLKKDGSADRPRARAWVPAIGSLLAAPLWAAFILADDPAVAALCLLGEYLTAECWFGPTLASLFSVVPKNRRGTAQGFFSVLTAAGNIAPVVVGAFAGGQLGSFALGDVLIGAVSGAYIVSGILFIFAAIEDEKRITLDWEKNKKA